MSITTQKCAAVRTARRSASPLAFLVFGLAMTLLAGCVAPAIAPPPGEIIAADLATGGHAYIYVAPNGSADIPGADVIDGRQGTVHVADGRIGIVVPIPALDGDDTR